MTQLIITAVGPDRPGIVGELSGQLYGAGANILDSRMVNLRGQFALMILLECDADTAARFERELPEAGNKLGLSLHVTAQPAAGAKVVSGLRYRLKTYSLDQPGIVARLTGLLRDRGVNIEELSAWQQSAPFAGDPLFQTEMLLTIPPKTSINALRAELSRVCNELNCDFDLEPSEG